MNTFDEDEYAYKIHFSKNFDCDSDSDNKSDFDDWYYKHKPPPAEIYGCRIVKIEPSPSKVNANSNSQNKIKSKRSWACVTKSVSDLNHKTQVFSQSNKPKREGTALTNLSGYQENKPNEIPKKKRNRKKKNQINRAKLIGLWPRPGSVQSLLEIKTDSIKGNVNSSFQYNNKDTKVLTELSQKCDNNVPGKTKRLISESIKNINGKSITETRFLLLDQYEKQSFLKFSETLQNTPKLNNVNKNKVTCNSKENVQNTGKSKSEAKELPLFGNEKESIVPNKNLKIDSTLKREAFNLSSFEWPSLHSVTSKKKLKSQKSKLISDDAICTISNKSSSVKDKHNKHESLQLNEQMKKNISQSYSNTDATGFLGIESRNEFWCLYNEKILSCSSKNIDKPKQSKVSTKINIQSTVKKEGSLNLSSKEETLVQLEALQSRNGLFINTSESSMGSLHNAKSNGVACHLSLPKSEKKDKPTDTCVNEEKPKKNKAQKQFGTNSSPPDKKSGSISLDKNHSNILRNSTRCNEVKQLEKEKKVNKSISSTEKNSHLLNNVQPKENLVTDTVVNGVQLTKKKKKKKKKSNQISELNLPPYDQTEVSELKQIKQKKTEKCLELISRFAQKFF